MRSLHRGISLSPPVDGSSNNESEKEREGERERTNSPGYGWSDKQHFASVGVCVGERESRTFVLACSKRAAAPLC